MMSLIFSWLCSETLPPTYQGFHAAEAAEHYGDAPAIENADWLGIP
jgi:hypothetical protein